MRWWWLAAVLPPFLATPAQAGFDPATQEQTLTFQVLQPTGVALHGAWIDLTRLGETRRVTLTDDGYWPSDVPDDGVWVGEDRGPFTRVVDVTLVVALPDAEPRPVLAETARTDAAWAATVSWRLTDKPEGLHAARASFAHPGRWVPVPNLVPLAGSFGWLIFLAVFVFGLLLVLKDGSDT